MSKDKTIAPDSFEPIAAWRCWGLAETEAGILLCSRWGDAIWPPRERWEATCVSHASHEPPEPGCACGIYALEKGHGIPYYGYDGRTYAVFGEVYLWGRVRQGTKGYRAQFGYPKALYLAHRDWRFVEPLKVYGVPVELRDPFEKEED